MNIIILCDSIIINGGASAAAIEAANAFCNNINYKVHYITIAKNIPLTKQLDDKINIVNLYRPINGFSKPIQKFWNFALIEKLSLFVDEVDPCKSVVHVHSWNELTMAPINYFLKKKFNVVFTLQDYALACPMGTFYNSTQETLCNKKALSLNCFKCNCFDQKPYGVKVFNFFKGVLQKHILKKYVKQLSFISISKIQESIMRPYISPKSNYEYIPNGLNLIKGDRISAEDNEIYLFVGRLTSEKGAHIFCEAISQAGLSNKAVVIGDGDLKDQLTMKYPAIKFLGWQTKQEINQWFTKTKAFVFPSIWLEGFSLIVQEALSKGLPVFVSNCTTSSELIEHNFNGYLIDPNNISDLAQQLLKLSQIDSKYISINAYNDFWKVDRSMDRHVNIIKNFYTKILQNAVF